MSDLSTLVCAFDRLVVHDGDCGVSRDGRTAYLTMQSAFDPTLLRLEADRLLTFAIDHGPFTGATAQGAAA